MHNKGSQVRYAEQKMQPLNQQYINLTIAVNKLECKVILLI